MTHTQKVTMLMALAVYAEHCKQMMRLLKSKESAEYNKKEIEYIKDAMAAIDELEVDHEPPQA